MAKEMFIRLYHGFASEQERRETDGWGAAGPTIGPIDYLHITYADHIMYTLENDPRKELQELWWDDKDAVIAYEGMLYGDLEIVLKEEKADS